MSKKNCFKRLKEWLFTILFYLVHISNYIDIPLNGY